MTVDEIEAALVGHLAALTLTPSLRVAWEDGSSFVPDDGETYIVPTFLPNRPERWAISAGMAIQRGLWQVTVRGPKSQHAITLGQIAQQVRDWFAEDTKLPAGDGRIRVYEMPEITRLALDDTTRDCVVTMRWTTA